MGPDTREWKIKERRIISYLENNGYDAAVIARRDNFSWITGGGKNHVVHTSEFGVSIAVIAKDHRYLAAYAMDGSRIMDEEMQNMDFELISLKWNEKSPAEAVEELLADKRAISDTALPGTDFKPEIFYDLHYPLTEWELERYRWLGQKAEEIVAKVAGMVKPGMSELDAQEMLLHEYARYDITAPVIIIGSDERIEKYRHCIPTEKKIGRLLMLAPAVQKWGLTVPLTRMVYFGDKLPDDIAVKYDAVCTIEAHTMAECTPGNRFSDILEMQKRIYAEKGYADEWKNHFQGGITGYVINNPAKCMDPSALIQEGQTFNWYITITGVKVEETFYSDRNCKEILTSKGIWPVKRYWAGDCSFDLPQIALV